MALLRSGALFPVVMLFAERFARRRKATDGLLFSAALALQLLGGNPGFTLVGLVAAPTYLLLRSGASERLRATPWRKTLQTSTAALAAWVCFGALGALMAAIQVYPTLLHIPHSVRDRDYAAASLDIKAARVRYLPQVLFPYAYEQGNYLPHPVPHANPAVSSGFYLGALAFGGACLALCFGRRLRHPVWIHASTGLIALLLALGSKTPLYPALVSLPIVDRFRFPSRFLIWVSFPSRRWPPSGSTARWSVCAGLAPVERSGRPSASGSPSSSWRARSSAS